MSKKIFVDKKTIEEALKAKPRVEAKGEPKPEAKVESKDQFAESVTETEVNAAKPAPVPVMEEKPAPQADPVAAVERTPQVSQEEYDRVKAERDLLVERLARLQAEFENARKREARERNEFREYAVAKAVEEFLPVLDNFQLALKSTGSAEQLRTGVELIVKQMEDALRTLNVQPIEAVGAVFDPRVHEAIEMVEKPDVPDHQVFDEVRRGYRIKERLLRPAMVRVASNPQQKEA